MKTWKDCIVKPDSSIHEVISIIDSTGFRIALVANEKQQLLGLVTDGDIRRAVLKNIPLGSPISKIMKADPKSSPPDWSYRQRSEFLKENKILQLPILTKDKTIIGLELSSEIPSPNAPKDNWVLIMAGGYGKRLRPYTEYIPKPMLSVGDKPVLERILETLKSNNFKKIFISTFYRSEQIQSYFGDGSRWGLTIEYLKEPKELGTAGCLSLLPKKPTSPLLVINGDVLTSLNYDNLLEFHRTRTAAATICVRKYDIQIPYGVATLRDFDIMDIEEKPVHSFFVSSGIYVLQPQVLDLVSIDEPLDMPDLLTKLIDQKKGVGGFPLREYWVDIGRVEDLFQANEDFDPRSGSQK